MQLIKTLPNEKNKSFVTRGHTEEIAHIFFLTGELSGVTRHLQLCNKINSPDHSDI